MKKILVLFFFISTLSYAQYSIKGVMQPAEKFSWVLLYKIEGAKEIYVKNTQVKKEGKLGVFEFILPSNTKVGSYRIRFAMKKNGFIEFLFNKENIEFEFNPKDPENTISYKKSKENKLFNSFFTDISSIQFKIDSLQKVYFKKPDNITKESYKIWVDRLQKTKKEYLQKSQKTLVYQFVKAGDRYNSPKILENPEEYHSTSLDHFFDHIDFSNKVLYNSSFLIKKILDYVFQINYSENIEIQKKQYRKASKIVLNKIKELPFKADIIELLISQFAAIKNAEMVDHLLVDYFDRLPIENQNSLFKKNILAKMSIAIGRIAPDFSWEENGKQLRLSELKDGLNYLLIFYSTECSHCLREVPEVFEFMKGKVNTKVIAFAMETSEKTWLNYHHKMSGWHHVLGLEKWRNPIARAYQINATPSYFILGMDKKIISTPQSIEDLKLVLEQLN
ncbi:MAG: Thiol-disulfide oxidoreductase ResA [Flavobacterium sp. SCGC AAA160-P02]|nr:MAG: Thiol-disulfide oxidoreductase ResA [Flavobacterium sp. SCGC AAA160-P02]